MGILFLRSAIIDGASKKNAQMGDFNMPGDPCGIEVERPRK